MARQYARKLSKRQARKRLGMTQSEFAKAVGVSRSTIQRAEKSGKTKNKNLLKIYENIERNRDISKEYKILTKMVKRRLDKLEEAGLEDTYLYRQWTEKGVPSLDLLMKDRSKVKIAMGQMNAFLGAKTSTVKGAKQFKKEQEARAKQIFDFDEEYEYEEVDVESLAWEVFNNIKNDPTYTKYHKGDKFDSTQAMQDIDYVIRHGKIELSVYGVLDALRGNEARTESYNRARRRGI